MRDPNPQQIRFPASFVTASVPYTYNDNHNYLLHIGNNKKEQMTKGKDQCDQKKIAKCLQKLPKNDFTRKMIDYDTFTKIA